MESTGYSASLQGAAFYPLEEGGFLRLTGPDRVDFLQRQTSRDVRKLTPGKSICAVLTSPQARILDVFYLLPEPGETPDEGSIGIMTLPGFAAKTLQFLKGRIFFKDNVRLVDSSHEMAQIDLTGPRAGHVLKQLGLPAPAEPEQAEMTGDRVWVVRMHEGFGLGYRLLLPADARSEVERNLEANGAARLTPQEYELRRVEAGLPGPFRELTEDYTPLETNLSAAVSDNKGCYTGQEVIARQLTYDKVTRYLTGLRLDLPVTPGAQVLVDDKPAGKVTSSLESPRLGFIALAVIKRPFHEPGNRVIVEEKDQKVSAMTVSLPFGD